MFRFMQFYNLKVPASIKAKQEKMQKMKSTLKSNEKQTSTAASPPLRTTRKVEVEEITTEVLDNLLNELMQSRGRNDQATEAKESTTINMGHISTEKENDIKDKLSEVVSVHSEIVLQF